MSDWVEKKPHNNMWEKRKCDILEGWIWPEYYYYINNVLIIEIVDYIDHYTLSIRSKTKLYSKSIEEDGEEYFMIFYKNKFSLEEVMTMSLVEAKNMEWPIKNITYKMYEVD